MMHRDPLIIGLAGRAGSGKDTAAQYLCSVHRFEAVAFADLINDIAAQLLDPFDVDHAVLHERALKEQPIHALPGSPSARQIKQQIGDLGRSWHPEFWITATAHRLGMHDMPRSSPVHDRIVISDVRLPDEAAWVAGRGGVVLRLVRPQALPVRGHNSESEVDTLPVNWEILNASQDPSDLYSEIEHALRRLEIDL